MSAPVAAGEFLVPWMFVWLADVPETQAPAAWKAILETLFMSDAKWSEMSWLLILQR
jgi:hypothetical protein